MKKHKFKVGQRVRVVKTSKAAELAVVGDTGTIKGVFENSDLPYAVEFDKKRNAYHSCGGFGGDITKSGYGYWCREEMLEPVHETIVIYRKNNQVIALDKRTGEKAVARCCPEDTFDFEVGAKLAFSRLMPDFEIPFEPIKSVKSICIGDSVEVINKEKVYPYYKAWSGLGIWKQNFVTSASPLRLKEYVVLTIDKHDSNESVLALIQDPLTTQVFIVNVNGLEKINR